MSATLTVEVADSDAVSRAAQEALDLTRSLGGHVVSASVATGQEGSASLTVRVPVARVQDAITGLSALGRIVSQQVTIDDLQEQLDTLERREASLRAQIARITARLETEQLDAETQALLEARRQTLQAELREIKAGIASTNAEARMSTIQLTVVTPGAFGAVAPPPSRLDRTIDEALNVLAWEGVVALGLLIVLAPFAVFGIAAWLGHRFYRRREEDRLLADLGSVRDDASVASPIVATSASATTFSGRPEIWLALRRRANASSSERPSRSMRMPFARSIALRAASASASESASSRSARSSSWRAVAVAIAGSRSLSRNGFTR